MVEFIDHIWHVEFKNYKKRRFRQFALFLANCSFLSDKTETSFQSFNLATCLRKMNADCDAHQISIKMLKEN